MKAKTTAKVTPLEFLEAVYEDERLPLTVRMRAAVEAAPYVHPKLSAVGVGYMNQDGFAVMLERAIERSNSVRVINAKALPSPIDEERAPDQD
jgi:hypothetical protein